MNALLFGPLMVAEGPVSWPCWVFLSDGGDGVVSRLVVFSSDEREEEECEGEGGGREEVGMDWVDSLHLTTSSGGCGG